MILYYSLNKYQSDLLFREVKDKLSFISINLNLLEILHFWKGNSSEHVPPYVYVDTDTLHRAFLVNQDGSKIVSFPFVFYIKTASLDLYASDNYIRSIQYMGKYGAIIPRYISEAKTILTCCSDKREISYRDLMFDDSDDIAQGSFELFEYLLFKESGYIRYDFDTVSFKPATHPVYHFDVNYSARTHYKLGLTDKIELEQMLSMLNLNSLCPLLTISPKGDVYKPYEIVKRIHKHSILKIKKKR